MPPKLEVTQVVRERRTRIRFTVVIDEIFTARRVRLQLTPEGWKLMPRRPRPGVWCPITVPLGGPASPELLERLKDLVLRTLEEREARESGGTPAPDQPSGPTVP